MTQLEKQLKGLNFSGTGALIGGSLVLGLGVALAKIGQEFADAKVQIERETGATGTALDNTFSHVKTVFAQVPESLKNTTTAVDELRRRGVPLGATFDTLAKQTLDLAKITGSDLGETVLTTTGLMAKFNVPLSEQPKMMDVLFKATQQSGVSLSTLSGEMLTGAAALQQFGFGFPQTAALLANLNKAAVNVGPALAGLRKGFAVIAKEGGDPQKVLADLLKEFTDGTPKTRALSDAIKLFGTRAGTELSTAIEQGRFNTKDMLKIITDGKGGILDTAEATRTFGEQLTIFKNKAEVAIEPLASAVWDGFRQIVSGLLTPVEHLGAALGGIAIGLAPVGALLGGAVLVAFKTLGFVIEEAAHGLGLIAAALQFIPAPLTVVVAAAGLLTYAFVLLGGATVGLTGAFAAASEASLAFAGTPLGAALIGVGLLAAAFHALGGSSHDLAVNTGPVVDALSATGVGVDNVTGKLSGLDAGYRKTIASALAVGGAGHTAADGARVLGLSYDTLTQALAGTDAQQEKVWTTIEAGTHLPGEAGKAARTLADALETLVDAQSAADKVNLDAAVSSGTFSQAQLDAALGTSESTANIYQYIAAMALLKPKIDAASESQAKAALQAGVTSGAISKLVDSFDPTNGSIATFTTQLTDAGLSAADAKTLAQDTANAFSAIADKATLASPAVQALDLAFIGGGLSAGGLEGHLVGLGVSVTDASAEVKRLQGDLDAFTKSITSNLPSAGDAVKSWGDNVGKAFQAVVDAAKKGPGEVAKAQSDLKKALDPQSFIDALNKEAADTLTFQGHLATLVSEGLGGLAAVIAQKGPEVGGQLAAIFANDKNKAHIAATAVGSLTAATDAMGAFASNPTTIAAMGGLGTKLGNAVNAGLAGGLSLKPPTDAEIKKAAQVLQNNNEFFNAAHGVGANASARFTLALNVHQPTKDEVARAQAVLASAGIPNDAHTLAATATGQYAGGLDLQGKTSDAVGGAKDAFFSPEQKQLADAAAVAGTDIGGIFAQGVASGMDAAKGVVQGAVGRLAAILPKTVKAVLSISSPSKVAIGLGQQFAAGFAIGVADTGPTVQAVDAMVKAYTGALDSTVTSTSSSSTRTGIALGAALVRGVVVGVDTNASAVSGAATVLAGRSASVITAGFGTPAQVEAARARLTQIQATVDAAAAAAAAADTASAARAAAVTTAATAAQSRIDALVSAAVGQLPKAATALATYADGVKNAYATLSTANKTRSADLAKVTADEAKFAATQAKVGAAQLALDQLRARDAIALAGKTSAAQRLSIQQGIDNAQRALDVARQNAAAALGVVATADHAAVLAATAATRAQTALRAAQNPQAFIGAIQQQNGVITSFQASLARLISLGDKALAAELLKSGPDVANAIAKEFAKDPGKAHAADAAIRAGQTYTHRFADFVTKNFAPTVNSAVTQAVATSPVTVAVKATATVTSAHVSATIAPSVMPAVATVKTATVAAAPLVLQAAATVTTLRVPAGLAQIIVDASASVTSIEIADKVIAAVPPIPLTGIITAVNAQGATAALPGSLATPALNVPAAAPVTAQTLVLDLTVNLPDGSTVKAQPITIPVPPPSKLTARVVANVSAQ